MVLNRYIVKLIRYLKNQIFYLDNTRSLGVKNRSWFIQNIDKKLLYMIACHFPANTITR